MKKITLVPVFILTFFRLFSQESDIYQKGITADKNLQAIGALAPYSAGGVGFDTRYEGIKGSPRLFDSFIPSMLKVKGQDYVIEVNTDIDLVGNQLLFVHPKTGKILTIPADVVTELTMENEGKEFVFRTTGGNYLRALKIKSFTRY